MMGLPGPGCRAFAYTRAADLRKGYNGLYALVRDELKQDPLCGDLFVFTNRRRTSVKVLRWDGTGLTIFMKRLEQGQFAWLRKTGEGESLELSFSEALLFLEGCQLVGKVTLSTQDYRLSSLAERGTEC